MFVAKGIVAILVAIVWAVGWMRIFGRAGHSSWYGLLMVVPLVNVVLWIWFAFGEQWPIQRAHALAASRVTQ